MVEAIVPVTILVVSLISYLLYRVHNANLQKKLFEHVVWCRTNHLFSYIRGFQHQLSIPAEYQIVGEQEEQYAKEILSAFLDNLEDKYFEGKLLPVRSKYLVPGDHYFALALWSYCYSHCCDSSIAGHEMHDKLLDKQHYGTSITSDWDASYSLSDFAVTFYKLYYIAFRFLGQSPIFNQNGTQYQDAGFLEKDLDSRTISVSYRQQY